MVCHGFKGGIGTASRKLGSGYTVGVLVQANYGSRRNLTVAGVPVGRELTELQPVYNRTADSAGGSSIIVALATDAPLLPHQLQRLARRAPLGIARVGGMGANSSGDIFIAFSTANPGAAQRKGIVSLEMLPNDLLTPLFEATVFATEEAIVNALAAAETMSGVNGNTVYALPHEHLRELLKKHNRLVESDKR
jgi:L-aminopeptidase/D-esterase-like protein